jgi:hypothetical protein
MDTETTTNDLVIIDAEIVEDAPNGTTKELTKTVATTAATAAVVLAGVYVYNFVKPKVASFIVSRGEKLIEKSQAEAPEPTVETPETEKV